MRFETKASSSIIRGRRRRSRFCGLPSSQQSERVFAFGCVAGVLLALLVPASYRSFLRSRSNVSQVFDRPDFTMERKKGANKEGNRTLVIVMGGLRCGEGAWNTLYKNVLDVNSADLAIMTGYVRPVYENSSLFHRAKYVWRHNEYADWGDAIDLINGTGWRTKVLPRLQVLDHLLGGINGSKLGSGAITGMIRWWISGRIQELGLRNIYDRFVITRSDHYYLCANNISKLDSKYIWAPEGEDYFGLCDRYIVGNADNILDVLDVIPTFMNDFDKSHVFAAAHNPESMLLMNLIYKGYYFPEEHVRRFRRMMFVCMSPGDDSRTYQTLGPFVKEGVHLKYEDEYTMARITCGL